MKVLRYRNQKTIYHMNMRKQGDNMLEKKDFEVLERMMKGIVKESQNVLEKKIDTAIEENNHKQNEKLKAIFEKNNREHDEKLRETLEKNNREQDERLGARIDAAVEKSENLLLEEMERYYKLAKEDIDRVSDKVDEIAEYYRIRKTEDNVSDSLMKLYHRQQEEIDEIKKVIVV